MSKLLELTAVLGRVNLFGRTGSGKTVLSWVLGKQAGNAYFASPSQIRVPITRSGDIAIIDNWNPSCGVASYATALLGGFRAFVLVTREKVHGHIISVELEVTSEDYVVANSNLYKYLGYAIPIVKESRIGLWHYLFREAEE